MWGMSQTTTTFVLGLGLVALWLACGVTAMPLPDAWKDLVTLPFRLGYVKGQLEKGADTDYEHWQLVAYFTSQVRLTTVRMAFGGAAHCEPTYSQAAEAYVWKLDTRVEGKKSQDYYPDR